MIPVFDHKVAQSTILFKPFHNADSVLLCCQVLELSVKSS